MKSSDVRLGIVCAVFLLAIVGFWWYALSDYRDMAVSISRLKADMTKMQQHVVTSEKILSTLENLKAEVRDAREAADERLERVSSFAGDERLDELIRLLNEDRVRRDSVGSACLPVGAGK